MQSRGVYDLKGLIKNREREGRREREMMMMMMMMMMKSRRKEVDEDDKKKGGHEEEEETRLKESKPTCRRPRSTLPASVNTWRPTIARLIHSDRLCAIKAFLYYPYSDCERN